MESVAHRADDSQSDGSLPSDDDGDADDSDLSETERPDSLSPEDQTSKAANGTAKVQDAQADAVAAASPGIAAADGSFARSQDTEAMMNGLKISEGGPQDEALDFETPTGPAVVTSDPRPPSQGGLRRQENFAERRRKEHEEYKKKRDADPAFIPTRGSFFMHDQRSHAQMMGRGRGRGNVVGGPFSPAKYVSRVSVQDTKMLTWSLVCASNHQTRHEPHGRMISTTRCKRPMQDKGYLSTLRPPVCLG